MLVARYLTVLMLLSSATALAMEEEGGSDVWTPKGPIDWGLSTSFGRSHGSSSPHRNQGSMAVTVNRVLTDAVGPGFLRGRMAVTVELVPLFLLSETSATYGAGFNLLGRHYLDTGGSVRPFITMGAGMILSRDAIPAGSAKLNFTPQAGIGLRWRTSSGRIFTVEYRFQHLSNGSRVDPNPGINSSTIQFGFGLSRALAQ